MRSQDQFQKSYLSDDPPFASRTSEVYNQQVAEMNNANSNTRREELSKQYGLVLAPDKKIVQPHGASLVPCMCKKVMDNVSVDECHDNYLGPWPQHFYLDLFYWTRTDKAGNHFTWEEFVERWNTCPWQATLKNDIPQLPNKLAGRDQSKGPGICGSDYVKGWPIPLQEHPFQWTSAGSLTVCIHAVALLEPLISNPDDPMWICLCNHQRANICSLKYSASVREIISLDALGDEWQGQFIAMWQLKPWYKVKDHNLRHRAERWVTTGPLRLVNCIKAEQALRLPKNDVMSSNWNNPLLTMATKSAKRVAWKVRSTWSFVMTCGEYPLYTETITNSHVLFDQLQLSSSEVESARVHWYRRVEHQKVPFEEGKFCLSSQDGKEDLCEVKSGLSCEGHWYLVVNAFEKYPNGQCYKRTAEGLLYVAPSMQKLGVQLICLSTAAVVPLVASHSSSRILLLDEI